MWTHCVVQLIGAVHGHLQARFQVHLRLFLPMVNVRGYYIIIS